MSVQSLLDIQEKKIKRKNPIVKFLWQQKLPKLKENNTDGQNQKRISKTMDGTTAQGGTFDIREITEGEERKWHTGDNSNWEHPQVKQTQHHRSRTLGKHWGQMPEKLDSDKSYSNYRKLKVKNPWKEPE